MMRVISSAKTKPKIPNNMKIRTPLVSIALLICFRSAPAIHADLISDWAETAGNHISRNAPTFFGYWRAYVMVHVAEFDAANAILGGYTPYALNLSAPGASPEAAVAQAAYTVLTNIGQANIAALDGALATTLNSIPDGPAKTDGVRVGTLAGETILRLRAADSPDLSVPVPPTSTAPGRWRPTPPNFAAAFGVQGRFILPWTMRSASQFRPGPPPALTSELYAKDYEEIRLLGARANTLRTPTEADSAQLRETGEDYLRDILAQKPLPLLESARRHALVFMAGMDALISVFDAKYSYNFWRPITAIRTGADDGNDATVGDSGWSPFLDTHSHPDYPSLLVQNTAAMFEILILLHSDDFSFSATSQNPDKTRTFAKLSDYISDAVTARVIGGTHFRNSCNVAAGVGRKIAQHAFQNFLQPLPNTVSGQRLNADAVQLTLTTGRVFPYLIETSSNLSQWQPWRTNLFGLIIETDSTRTADRRFYRATPRF